MLRQARRMWRRETPMFSSQPQSIVAQPALCPQGGDRAASGCDFELAVATRRRGDPAQGQSCDRRPEPLRKPGQVPAWVCRQAAPVALLHLAPFQGVASSPSSQRQDLPQRAGFRKAAHAAAIAGLAEKRLRRSAGEDLNHLHCHRGHPERDHIVNLWFRQATVNKRAKNARCYSSGRNSVVLPVPFAARSTGGSLVRHSVKPCRGRFINPSECRKPARKVSAR
jgi:hypothetical protein